jgi:hypothetical protein
LINRADRLMGPVRNLSFPSKIYFPSIREQWVAADFHVPESFTQVSLHITDRARCLPPMSAS